MGGLYSGSAVDFVTHTRFGLDKRARWKGRGLKSARCIEKLTANHAMVRIRPYCLYGCARRCKAQVIRVAENQLRGSLRICREIVESQLMEHRSELKESHLTLDAGPEL